MDIAKLQQQINREAWARYRGAQAATSGTPAAREVADFIAEHARKHGKASESPRVVTPTTDGPQTKKAKELTIAIAKARAGNVAEANGVHKLAPYVFGG